MKNLIQGPPCTKEAELRKPNWLTHYDNQLEELGANIFESNPSQNCASSKSNPNINGDHIKSWKI